MLLMNLCGFRGALRLMLSQMMGVLIAVPTSAQLFENCLQESKFYFLIRRPDLKRWGSLATGGVLCGERVLESSFDGEESWFDKVLCVLAIEFCEGKGALVELYKGKGWGLYLRPFL